EDGCHGQHGHSHAGAGHGQRLAVAVADSGLNHLNVHHDVGGRVACGLDVAQVGQGGLVVRLLHEGHRPVPGGLLGGDVLGDTGQVQVVAHDQDGDRVEKLPAIDNVGGLGALV